MPIPDSDFDDFSIMVDPIKGRISMICPAPIIGFNTIGDFKEFVSMLESWIPALEGRIVSNEGAITKEYGEQVLEQWQEDLKTYLLPKPKQKVRSPGPKKSGSKPKTSLDKEDQ